LSNKAFLNLLFIKNNAAKGCVCLFLQAKKQQTAKKFTEL